MSATTDDIRHFVVTRHAVQRAGSPLPSADWLEARRRLLVDLAARSLAAQTCPDFTWLILVDDALADRESALLADALGQDLQLRVIRTRGALPAPGGVPATRALSDAIGIGEAGVRVLTTRLDSDDALAPTFCRVVRDRAALVDDTRSLDLVDGAVVDRAVGIPLLRPYRASPFQSLVETSGPGGRITTVLRERHDLLPQVVPYTVVRTRAPMWFVSVHGGNIGNRAAGRPAPADVVPEHLRGPLGVRDSTRAERVGYGLRVAAAHTRRILDRGDAAGISTLAGHARARLLGR